MFLQDSRRLPRMSGVFSFSFLIQSVTIFTQLSNHLFEELAMDVYDEVDRRETDAGRAQRRAIL